MDLHFWTTLTLTLMCWLVTPVTLQEAAAAAAATEQCCPVLTYIAGIHALCIDKQLSAVRLFRATAVSLDPKSGSLCWEVNRSKANSTTAAALLSSNSKVVWLDLSVNSLTSFPEVSHLIFSELHHLNLSHNRIREVSAERLRSLPHLQSLDLSFNRLSVVPDFAHVQLPVLSLLDLSHNGVQEIPGRSFQGLFELKTLALSHNRIQRIVSDSFLNVSALQSLTLRGNLVHSLPLGAFDERLTELDLSGNLLEALPGGIFQSLAQLKTLNLSHNQLSDLTPTSLRGMPSLQTLDLSSNQMESIPRGLFEALERLCHLTLARNKVKAVSVDTLKGLRALKDLDLSSNHLTTIRKAAYTHLHQLLRLNLNSNALKQLHEHVFAGLKWLEHLDLSGNSLQLDLQSLPADVFSPLENLRTLLLAGNDLRTHGTYPAAVFTPLLNLRHLSIDTFSEATFPPEFPLLPTLRKVDLPHCKMTSVTKDTFRAFRGSSLQQLRLSDCPLNNVQECAFCDLHKLESLSITHNSSPGPLRLPKKLLDTDGSAVRHLTLSDMRLSGDAVQTLADHTLKNLDGLEVLDLSHNGLKSLNLTLKASLKELRLAGNRFQSIPANLSALKRLTELDMRDNELTFLTLAERGALDRLADTSHLSLRLQGNRVLCPPEDCGQVQFWSWLASTRVKLNEGGVRSGGYPCVAGEGVVVTVAEAVEVCRYRMLRGCLLAVVVAVVTVGVGVLWWSGWGWGWGRGRWRKDGKAEPMPSSAEGCGTTTRQNAGIVLEYDQVLTTSTTSTTSSSSEDSDDLLHSQPDLSSSSSVFLHSVSFPTLDTNPSSLLPQSPNSRSLTDPEANTEPERGSTATCIGPLSFKLPAADFLNQTSNATMRKNNMAAGVADVEESPPAPRRNAADFPGPETFLCEEGSVLDESYADGSGFVEVFNRRRATERKRRLHSAASLEGGEEEEEEDRFEDTATERSPDHTTCVKHRLNKGAPFAPDTCGGGGGGEADLRAQNAAIPPYLPRGPPYPYSSDSPPPYESVVRNEQCFRRDQEAMRELW